MRIEIDLQIIFEFLKIETLTGQQKDIENRNKAYEMKENSNSQLVRG